MVRRGVDVDALAQTCSVDPKTAERWVSPGRVPTRKHRWMAAKMLEEEETYLWPTIAADGKTQTQDAHRSELVETFPDRASVPRETWFGLLTEAKQQISVLVYSGTFYAQTQPRIASMLGERIAAGVQVRLCFGQPDSPAVAIRDTEEGLGGTLPAKIRASLGYYRDLAKTSGCEIRLHSTTLYASLFRYDADMIVNPHAYGSPASLNPSFYLRWLDGGTLFDHYAESFERVWSTAEPWLGQEV
jgi:hypothetical protein